MKTKVHVIVTTHLLGNILEGFKNSLEFWFIFFNGSTNNYMYKFYKTKINCSPKFGKQKLKPILDYYILLAF